jgi:hypothetical protein
LMILFLFPFSFHPPKYAPASHAAPHRTSSQAMYCSGNAHRNRVIRRAQNHVHAFGSAKPFI